MTNHELNAIKVRHGINSEILLRTPQSAAASLRRQLHADARELIDYIETLKAKVTSMTSIPESKL